MQINVTARHLDLTPAIEDYARGKAAKLPRYFDRVQQVEILVDKVKHGYEVEIITTVEHHEPFIAKCREEDLYACLDLGIDKAVRQLTDHKSKLRDNRHPHHAGSQQHEAS